MLMLLRIVRSQGDALPWGTLRPGDVSFGDASSGYPEYDYFSAYRCFF
jgi:hypothetical protein